MAPTTPQPIGVNNQLGTMTIKSELSMIDGKMVDILQGDSGSFCHLCKCSRNEANDVTQILGGFTIEKSFEQMTAIWNSLEDGSLRYNQEERYEQCHRPMKKKSMFFVAIMHQKLRSLDHCLKLLYHLVSGQTHTWSESNANVKQALSAAKKEIIDHVRVTCGFLLDCPTTIGGNTNSGPIAERFFSPESRMHICSKILKEDDRSNFQTLLSYFNRILSITQHCDESKSVNPQKLKDLGLDLMLHHRRSFGFARISPTVHQMAAHAWELFEITEGKPISTYSEQAGEAWNKHIRAFKSGPGARARQSSIMVNTQDIFTRMLIQTHPRIVRYRRFLNCSRCTRHGHTVRSCPLNVHMALSEEKATIEECFI